MRKKTSGRLCIVFALYVSFYWGQRQKKHNVHKGTTQNWYYMSSTINRAIYIFIIRYYFQTPTPDTLTAYGFFGVIKHYGWKKVRLVAQDENVFITVS